MKYEQNKLLIRDDSAVKEKAAYLYSMLAIVLAYFLVARVSLLLAVDGYASPVWPPTGISLAILFLVGKKFWPGITLGAFATNMQVDGSVQLAAQIAIGNTLEAVIGVWLIDRIIRRRYFLNHSRAVFIFLFIVLLACSISALIGALTILHWPMESISFKDFFRLYSTWWIGDVVGAIVLMPLALAFINRTKISRQPYTEITLFSLLSLIILVGIFSDLTGYELHSMAYAFIPVPLMIAAGYRYGLRGLMLFIVSLSMTAIFGTYQGCGPFAGQEMSASLVMLQAYIGLVTGCGLLINSIIAEKEFARSALERLGGQLERRVQLATDQIRQSNLLLAEEKRHQQGLIEQLSNSEKRYRALFDNAPEAVVLFDMEQAALIDVNENAEALFGYSRTELLSIGFADLSPEKQPDGKLSLDAAFSYLQLAEQGVEQVFQWTHLNSKGQFLPCEVRLVRFPDPDKVIIRGSLTDISARLQAFSKKLLIAKLFDNTSEAVVITSVAGDVLEVNNACCEMTGYCQSDLTGQYPAWLFYGCSPSQTELIWQRVVTMGHWQGELTGQHHSGSLFIHKASISSVIDDQSKVTNYLIQFSDITETKVKEERLAYLANYDHLTGIYNRACFITQMERMLIEAKREHHILSLYFIDMDGFKRVNDSLGHDVGDQLLTQVAGRIKGLLRDSDLVARLGGDEFTLLAKHNAIGAPQKLLASKLINSLSAPFIVTGNELYLTVSIGITNAPQDGTDSKTLFKNADLAMYQVKEDGRNNYQFFTRQMNHLAQQKMEIETQLRKALERNEFELHYQPQYALDDHRLVGYEALIRWQHPEKGLLMPGAFIEVAEQSGLITRIGHWVLAESCRQSKQWQDGGYPAVPVAVNISAIQFRFPEELLLQVGEVLTNTGIDPAMLELELTESMLVENVAVTIQTLKSLKDMGIKLAIDDFGTGYSSLAYLKRFAADKLKIDRSFVNDIGFDAEDCAIVSATIALGRSLGLQVIAEGVETDVQLNFLKAQGCDEAQGYYFSKPLAVDAMIDLLEQQAEQVADAN
ncbi:EAL domain-containing protein [Amphritea balenae]|uniref:cyclic-guanylate-specific phosphodiesterase n=1 Tax=Amphritea balenae TaxID=452629 RepID=A0A3P1SME2_9GAMM|nr:EAL domain-containing protein [Amphritea balenae]RRC98084.1 EAL domain-containing protein [Amphritea balenae]GGK67425.1 hypothetical protein GCM10007941_16900 [Amphritea balenae]